MCRDGLDVHCRHIVYLYTWSHLSLETVGRSLRHFSGFVLHLWIVFTWVSTMAYHKRYWKKGTIRPLVILIFLTYQGRLYEAKMALCWLQSSGTFFCTKGPERRDDIVRVNLENRIDAEIQTILVSYQRKISNEKVRKGSPPKNCLSYNSIFKVGYWMRYASLFYRKDVWKPLIIIFVMFLMQQFSGLTTITYYAVDVLSDSHSSVNEYLGTIIFGITRLAAHFLGSFMLLRFKRKHLFISSALITGIGMTCLGFTNSQWAKSHNAIINKF